MSAALVESAMYNVKLLEDNDFNFKISVKSSDVFLTVKSIVSYQKFVISIAP